MIEANKLHHEAMMLTEEASIAKLKGDIDQANLLLHSAFEKERDAAGEMSTELEPTRSVLYRSAASLGLECGKLDEAESLVYIGLSGSPPRDIYEELRSILEEINFHRHLSLHGLKLLHNEFQMSMWGDVVAHGMTRTDELFERLDRMKKLMIRTVERRIGEKFREGGRPKKAIADAVELYVSVPRAASFAVSFRLGASDQLEIPGIPGPKAPDAIIDDIFENFRLYNKSDTDALRGKIKDPAYYRNFVGLAREIAPDGEAIRRIGFTTLRKGEEQTVQLTLPREEAPSIEPEPIEFEKEQIISVKGRLLYADEMKEGKEIIKLKDEKGKTHKIKVPSGMMSDIVKPMWESEVIVSGYLHAGWIALKDIRRVKD